MALNFPNNPVDGDIYRALGRGWKYNATASAWEALIRVDTAFDSDDIVEGAVNLYQNPENIQDEVNNLLIAGTNITLTYDDVGNSLTIDSSNTGGYDLSNNDTNNLAEGSDNSVGESAPGAADGTNNLYYTDARADARVNLQTGANLDLSSKSTTDLAEGTNLYYTTARANADFDTKFAAASITGLSDADQTVQTTDNVTFNNTTLTGYLAGPATFTIDPSAVGDNTGTVVIAGNLQVDGTTTTINSTTLDVDDLNITIASGAPDAASADGAGLTVDGASATLTYASTGDKWVFNKPVYENTYKLLSTNDTITSSQLDPAFYVSQTFTGDNTTTAFTLNNDPGNSQTLLVLVDNVVQEPAINYTTSSTTLTFTSAPALNARIYVRYLGLPGTTNTVTDGSITNAKLNLTYSSNQYTGDNTTVDFTIASGHTVDSLLVVLDGLILPPSDYAVNGTTLTFVSAPLLNQSIDIRYMPV